VRLTRDLDRGTFVAQQAKTIGYSVQKKDGGMNMIRTDLLRGRIAQNGTSQRKLATQLGITEKTFYQKMKRGVFSSDEIFQMMGLLGIDDPKEIFFAEKVAH
jgi:DNA-binding NtrC family response regulator